MMRKQLMLFLLILTYFWLYGQEKQQQVFTESIQCDETFQLTAFQLSVTDNGNAPIFPYKVVIGRGIDYRTSPIADGIRFLWKLGSYNSDGVFSQFLRYSLRPLGADSLTGSGQAIVLKDSLSMLINHLGRDTAGVVFVEKHTALDTQAVYSSLPSEINKLEVFFDKDTMNIHNTNQPNWFYYWTKIPAVVDLLTIPGIRLYDTGTCQYNETPTPYTIPLKYWPLYTYLPPASVTYGTSQLQFESAIGMHVFCPSDTASIRSPAVGYDDFFSYLRIGTGCGFHNVLDTNLLVRGEPRVDLRGIHTFFSTFIHEREHLLITCEVWAAGYNRKKDTDNDGYNDDWEAEIAVSGENPFVGFTTRDPLDPMWRQDKYGFFPNGTEVITGYNSGLLFQMPPIYSMGTEYEEYRCRLKERDYYFDGRIRSLDNHDWSFDPSNINQGKQWK